MPLGGGGGGGGGDEGEWFASAPKQWMFNAFQNHKLGVPKLFAQRSGRSFTCRVSVLGTTVSGEGHSAKDAENAAALEGCRLFQRAGKLQRQVSSKQRGHGLCSNKMALITSDCVKLRPLSTKWP